MPNLFQSANTDTGLETSVVQTALELYRRDPFKEPLQILDAAIGHRHGYQLDYEFENEELRPPHPFAELLRKAFAPWSSSSSLTPDKYWACVILPFARRYHIWEPYRDDAATADEPNNVTSLQARGDCSGHSS